MSGLLSDRALHDFLEKIAARGCADVNQLIVDIENGARVPEEIAHLSESRQQQVIDELRNIMRVYDNCETDPE